MAENENLNSENNENSENSGNSSNSGFEDLSDWIFNHKIAVIGLLALVPILAFTIIGFKNNHYILGCISISFLITLFILLYAISYKTGKISHLFLLVFLLFLQIAFPLLKLSGHTFSQKLYVPSVPKSIGISSLRANP